MIHKQTLDVYQEVFKSEIVSFPLPVFVKLMRCLALFQANYEKSYYASSGHSQSDSINDQDGAIEDDSQESNRTAVFGEDMGLFISQLYNFYQSADFQVKKEFLNLIDKYILRFEKELLLSLSAFVLCIIPALDEQNDDHVMKVHQILNRTEKIVGTSKLFGEIWKTMLRSPRSRLTAIKYLDQKIPRNMYDAVELNKSQTATQPHRKSKIYLSKYNVVVSNG